MGYRARAGLARGAGRRVRGRAGAGRPARPRARANRLLLYYRGLSGTKASYATLAEISFPASAVILNWVFLGAGVSANQILGFALLWGAILALGYLNAPGIPHRASRRGARRRANRLIPDSRQTLSEMV